MILFFAFLNWENICGGRKMNLTGLLITSPAENLNPAMGRGINSRNRVWNWVAKLHRLAGRYDNPMPTWFLAPIAGLKLPTQYIKVRVNSTVYLVKCSKCYRIQYNHAVYSYSHALAALHTSQCPCSFSVSACSAAAGATASIFGETGIRKESTLFISIHGPSVWCEGENIGAPKCLHVLWSLLLFPSPVKNLWSSLLKSLPQYFYSSKNDGFMKNFLSIPF